MDSKISSSSSSSSIHKWEYDVLLSFRGEDTCKNFTDHPYATLKQKRVNTFRDDKNLKKGEPISLELLKAIEESRFAVVILSKNYASSTWCLDELVKIMKCKKQMGQTVLPSFYDVDPSGVRKQIGTYAQAFDEHEKCFKENVDKVHEWRGTLTNVANLSGFHLQNRHESKFIQDIVEEIMPKLSFAFPRDTKGLVGIEYRVKELMSLLTIGSNDVRIIGIWGMGGIGKTILARVVYQMIFNDFEGGCFINNIREESEKHGLLPSQQKLICEILGERSTNIRDVEDGVHMIKKRLCHKRILLVLDDVNQFNQLDKLAKELNWFGPGSRVIITTRDKSLLKRYKVFGIYEVNGLSDYDALHLFSLKAFDKDHPAEDFLKLSKQFVNYAKGLPLAIEVLGSFLFNRSKEEWESALNRLNEFPEKGVIQILQLSSDTLHETEKEIFLHIACFFNMKAKYYVVEILDCLGLCPKIGLRVLIEKSLLKELGNEYSMHELLQTMGQNIVRKDNPQEPGRWSKLWLYKDICNVLVKNLGTEANQGLVLKLPKVEKLHKSEKKHWNLEALSKMSNLKLLIIHGVQVLHDPKHLSNNLRLLDWSGYPSKSLPSNFEPDELVELQLLDSKIERLWKGTKYLDKLKFIKLNNSLNLIATPDFTGVPNLEQLVFNGCINLHEVHPSIMVLKRLTLVDLENCKSLKSLPSKFEMESLEVLILSGCSKIKRIPEFIRNMERLSKLHLDGTAITKLPSSVEHLSNLASLQLRDCKNLLCLPSTICSFKSVKYLNLAGCKNLCSLPSKFEMKSLEVLNFSGCLKIKRIPEFMGNMKRLLYLHLDGTAITELPSSIEHLTNLASLHLRDCKNLVCLPSINYSFKSLKDINLAGCLKLDNLPEKLCNVESLEVLDVSGIAFREPPSSVLTLKNLNVLSFRGCKGPPPKLLNKLFPLNLMQRRSLNPVSLLLPSLLGICSLKRLDLSDCNLQTIPNDFGNLSSIIILNLSENHFSCLPESIVQLSKLQEINLCNCTRLRSLPQLPSTTSLVTANGCTSLETFPNGLKPHDYTQTNLFFINCFRLADNHGRSDMFFNVLRMLLTEICKRSINVNIVIPGSEIPKWFSHQSVGNIVNAQVTHPNKNVNIQVLSHSRNMWIGMTVCAVFSFPNFYPSDIQQFLNCCILINKLVGSVIYAGFCPKVVQIKSRHLWMSYIPSQAFKENERAVLSQIDENEFIHMEVRFRWYFNQYVEFKKCGFRPVYEQDIEDIKEMILAQSSNSTCVTPYEGLDVHHNFDNSTKGIKLKRSRDEYDGTGPIGEDSSNDVPHSKRIER